MTQLRQPFLAILAGLMMGGCSLFSGGSNEAPPTQVALSLYAGPDVNPNPLSVPLDAPVAAQRVPPPALAVDEAGADGPYELNLKGNKGALVEQLKTLLEYFQIDDKAAGIRVPASRAKSRSPLPSQEQQDIAPRYPLDTPTTPLPVQWTLPKGAAASREMLNPPLPLDGAANRSRSGNRSAPALGQYADGTSFDSSEERDRLRAESSVDSAAVATPVSFKILQLKDDTIFLGADYDHLAKDLKKTLGSTHITDDDYVLQPGQFKYIEYANIDKKTRFIAVLANFHSQNGATWKQLLRLESRGYRYALLVILRGSEVAITDEGYRTPHPSK